MSNRLSGKFGVVTLGGVKIAECHGITVTLSPKYINSLADGEVWGQSVMTECDFSVDVQKFESSGNVGALLGAVGSATLSNATPLTIAVYTAQGGTKVFEGPVWPGDADYQSPQGDWLNEGIKFVKAGAPTYIAGVTFASA